MRVSKRVKAAPLDRPPRSIIRRYNVGDYVRSGQQVLIGPDFWHDHIRKLPNAPIVVSDYAREPHRYPAKMLWWDGDNDIVCVQYQAYRGTGHRGIYDSYDAEPFFDASRSDWVNGQLLDGCVFVPTSAIDFERLGLKPELVSAYKSDLTWPTAAMICNLAQYRIAPRVIGEALGVTRQAVHLALAKLPDTIRELTEILRRGDVHVGQCQYDGCIRPAATPGSTLCKFHDRMPETEGMIRERNRVWNAENPAPRPFIPRPRRRRYAVRGDLPPLRLDAFLPLSLVDQRSKDGTQDKSGEAHGIPDPGSTDTQGNAGGQESRRARDKETTG